MVQEEDPTKKITSIVQEAPPTAPQYDWKAIADQLRESPMEWHKIFAQGRISLVNAINQGSVGELHRDLGFETTTRMNRRLAPRVADLYARYNPALEKDLRAVIHSSRKAKS